MNVPREAARRTPCDTGPRARTRAGSAFTLLEMVAVVLLTAMVFTAAVDFYLDLSRSSARAAELTRSARRATAALDRVARDLEGATLLVKPEEMDPLEHPWLFLAESERSDSGADRLKFVTRRTPLQTRGGDAADLGFVVWMTQPDETGTLTLLRWTSGDFPSSLDRSFPPAEDAAVVARGLAAFGVRLLDEEGAWQKAWDSSQVERSSQLPLAAEIELSFPAPESANGAPAAEPLALAADASPPFVKRISIPVRPLDLEALTDEGTDEDETDGAKDEDGDGKPDDESESAENDDEDGDCITVSACLARNPQAAAAAAAAGLSAVLQSIGGQCFSDVKANLPPGLSLSGCE